MINWRHSFILIILLASIGFAHNLTLDGLDSAYISFIKAEMDNSYQATDSTVDQRYRGKTLEPFRVGYLEIPAERLNIETSHANNELLKNHFYVTEKNKSFVRFFIHPDSEHLYQSLINEFGYKGHYLALPTASTRTVLAWDPSRQSVKPLFLKLSLAQKQDDLGRVIPAWEIRRSVRVTEQIDSDIKSGRIQPIDAHVIPEVAGAYVKSSENLTYFVDKKQGEVAEHGFILRDASFIEKYKSKKVVPMFWLFSKNKGQEPPIISLWKKSTFYSNDDDKPSASFIKFLAEKFFRPFIQKNLPLMLHQGIVPQIHGQNVILVLNPHTGEIESSLHRDIGSMKTDYRLRWINKLPVSELRSTYADKDFGLSWGAENIENYHMSYLHDWLFEWTYLDNIKEYFKNFNPNVTRRIVRKILNEEISKLLDIRSSKIDPKAKIIEYIEKHPPSTLLTSIPKPTSVPHDMHQYLTQREYLKQTAALPISWQKLLALSEGSSELKEVGFIYTNYGIIYSSKYLGRQKNSIRIAFYDQLENPEKNLPFKNIIEKKSYNKTSAISCRSLF